MVTDHEKKKGKAKKKKKKIYKMDRPRRKRRLPDRLGQDKSPSGMDEEPNLIEGEQEPTLLGTEEPIQNQPNPQENKRQRREDYEQARPISRKILERRPNVKRNQRESIGPMFRMMRRSLGTLMEKVNSLSEEVKVTKAAIENGEKPNLYGEKLASTSEVIEKDIREQIVQCEEGLTEKEHSQVIYNIRNISVEKPKFGEKDVQPVTFLEDLEIYLRKSSKEGKELDLIQDCLVGDARDWARVYKERWIGIEDFKKDFLATYWGEREQNELRRTIVQGIWDRADGVSMLNHFIKLTGRAKMLSFTIPERQLVSDIIRHYPKYIQQGWLTSKIETIIETAEFLRSLDDLNKQDTHPYARSSLSKEKEKKKESPQNYKNWPKPVGFQKLNNKTQATVNQLGISEDRRREYQRSYGDWQKSTGDGTSNSITQAARGPEALTEGTSETWEN